MMNGAEYIASLNDGRAVYHNGERIANVANHPALATAVKSAAADYDYFSSNTKPGSTSDFLSPPRTVEALREHSARKVDFLTRVTYTSIMTLLTAGDRIAKTRPQGTANIRAFVRHVQEKDLRITESITDAKGDRGRPPGQQDDKDAYLRIVGRRSDGVIIRGAKLHVSLAPIGHELMTIPTKAMKPGEEEYAVACAVSVNSPGVKIINVGGPPSGDERDFPFSSRGHHFQGFVIYDDVFVPHERVFLDGEVKEAASFAHSLGLWIRANELTNLARDADMLVGFAQLIAEANGLDRVPHIKDKIAEMSIHATLIRATLEASYAHSKAMADGAMFPDELYTNVGKYQGASNYSMMVRHLHDISGGSATTAPSIRDLENAETGQLLRKYMTTKQSVDGAYRLKLFHAIRDLTASEFAGHQAVAIVQGGGGLFAQRTVTRGRYDIERAKRLALEASGLSANDAV